MNQKKLSRWLKGITIVLVLMLLCILFLLIPLLQSELSMLFPERQASYRAYFIVARVMVLPCFAALAMFWKLCVNIGADRSFCAENVRLLRRISLLAVADSVICFASAVVFTVLQAFHTEFYIATMLIVTVGIAVAIASAVLAHLTEKAAALKAENDLTI